MKNHDLQYITSLDKLGLLHQVITFKLLLPNKKISLVTTLFIINLLPPKELSKRTSLPEKHCAHIQNTLRK